MIEVLVTGSIACAICGAWWASHNKTKMFFNRLAAMDVILDEFIKLNDIEYFDFVLKDPRQDLMAKQVIHDEDLEWVGKDIEKGFDFYRMRMREGVTSLNHRHEISDEFFYVLSGEICVTFDDGVKTCIKEGDHLFVRNKVYHNVIAMVDSDIIVVAKPSLIRRK